MLKEIMHNGYKVAIDVEEVDSIWRGRYVVRLDGALICDETVICADDVKDVSRAESVIFGIAQTRADKHHRDEPLFP